MLLNQMFRVFVQVFISVSQLSLERIVFINFYAIPVKLLQFFLHTTWLVLEKSNKTNKTSWYWFQCLSVMPSRLLCSKMPVNEFSLSLWCMCVKTLYLIRFENSLNDHHCDVYQWQSNIQTNSLHTEPSWYLKFRLIFEF